LVEQLPPHVGDDAPAHPARAVIAQKSGDAPDQRQAEQDQRRLAQEGRVMFDEAAVDQRLQQLGEGRAEHGVNRHGNHGNREHFPIRQAIAQQTPVNARAAGPDFRIGFSHDGMTIIKLPLYHG